MVEVVVAVAVTKVVAAAVVVSLKWQHRDRLLVKRQHNKGTFLASMRSLH